MVGPPAAAPPASAQTEPSVASRPAPTKRTVAFVYFGHFVRYVYLFILVPFYGRVLGAEEYGRVLAAMSLYQLVWMLVEFGLPTVGMRAVAGTADRPGLSAIYGRQLMGRATMLIPGLAVGIGGTFLSPLLALDPRLGLLATFNAVVAAFNLGWFFEGSLRFRTAALLEMGSFCLSLPLILLSVHGPNDGWHVLASLSLSSVICSGTAHIVAWRHLDRRSVRLSGGLSLIREAVPLFAAKGTGMIMTGSSTYLLSLMAGAAQVGWYGAADRLAGAAMSLTVPMQRVFVSTVCQRLGTKATEASGFLLIRRAFYLITAGGIVLFIGTQVIAGVLVPLALGPDFIPAVSMLRILGCMFPFTALSQVVISCIFIPLRFDRLITLANAAAAVITLLLMLGLGHAFAGIGVAWARCLGELAMAMIVLAVLRHKRLLGLLRRP